LQALPTVASCLFKPVTESAQGIGLTAFFSVREASLGIERQAENVPVVPAVLDKGHQGDSRGRAVFFGSSPFSNATHRRFFSARRSAFSNATHRRTDCRLAIQPD
jgi:hypothetical protein